MFAVKMIHVYFGLNVNFVFVREGRVNAIGLVTLLPKYFTVYELMLALKWTAILAALAVCISWFVSLASWLCSQHASDVSAG